jgi:MscS family membrane protein
MVAVMREWLLGAGVLFLTFAARGTVNAFLKSTGTKRGWILVTQLAPSIANLIYIIGLRIFIEVAPLNDKLSAWVDSGIYVVAVILVLGMIRRAAMIGIEWSTSRSVQSNTLQQGFIPLLRNLITLFVFFSGSIMVLKRFNYDVMSLLTALGVGSLAVGLAAKDTLSNMISGFTLIIDRNLRPGDRINLAGAVGDVDEIGLRSTRLKMGDGNMLIVPNSELVNTRILNLSLPSRETTASTFVRVAYDVPFSVVRDHCLQAVAQVEKLNTQRGKWVNLTQVAEGYQNIQVGFWVRDMDDVGAALTDFHEKLLARLASANIPLYVSPIAPAPSAAR